MLSINNNLQSFIAQTSLKTSTNKLNTAVERMSTGFKINGAKDNAANYSITTNMSTQISAYNIAEDNVAMGLDYITTASDSLDLINDKLARLRALAEQAANGTYGKQSVNAMNKEAAALINEIYRIRNTTSYNGQSVYGASAIDEQTAGAKGLEVKDTGFLQDIEVRDTSKMTTLASIDENTTLAKGTYSISSAEELAKLAKMQNAGKIEAGSEFVLGADIDLSAYSSGEGWTPIGWGNNHFIGTFDGNGHKITNLYIDRENKGYQGLFSYCEDSVIKNLGVESGKIRCGDINSGVIVGMFKNSDITNCYTGVDIVNDGVSETNWLGANGGLVGRVYISADIDYCYTTGNITSTGQQIGGLVGLYENGTISNCFATGNISATSHSAGGLVGQISSGKVENCFSTGDVSATSTTGGLIGSSCAIIIDCHSTGNVTSKNDSTTDSIGGLIGCASGTISNCYATGDVYTDGRWVGGLIGTTRQNETTTIKDCFATGNVTASGDFAGGLLASNQATSFNIENCYATGNVSGKGYVGGLMGYSYGSNPVITACYATGNVTASDYYSGGLCGYLPYSAQISDSYATGNVNGQKHTGGLIGYASSATITNSYASGTAQGTGSYTGGLIGYAYKGSITNCYVLGDTANVKGAIAGYANGTISNCFYDEEKNSKINGSGTAAISDCQNYQGSEPFKYNDNSTDLQVGIYAQNSSQITMDTTFELGNLRNLLYLGIQNGNALGLIDNAISSVSAVQTQFGAVQNRLENALDEISTHYENLVSSRSTLRDADIAGVSSEYIKQQILQQASATLLAAANQAPALALQLL